MRNGKLSRPIDATKYDIRVLWTGLKEEHVSADAGIVEGYPLDPPDDGDGWYLVDWGVETMKESDRYWTLWAREKTAPKRKKRAAAAKAPPAPKEKKPRTRRARPEPSPPDEQKPDEPPAN